GSYQSVDGCCPDRLNAKRAEHVLLPGPDNPQRRLRSLGKGVQRKIQRQGWTPESKAMYERLILVGNRAVDAYARAVALSTKPEQAKSKSQAMAELTDLYKGLHQGSDAGLSDLIATVLSKPMPQ